MAPVFLTRGDLKKELQRLQDSKRQQVGRLDASALERLELEIKTTQGRLTELEQLLQSEPHLVDMAAKLRDLDISPDPQRDQAAVSTASQSISTQIGGDHRMSPNETDLPVVPQYPDLHTMGALRLQDGENHRMSPTNADPPVVNDQLDFHTMQTINVQSVEVQSVEQQQSRQQEFDPSGHDCKEGLTNVREEVRPLQSGLEQRRARHKQAQEEQKQRVRRDKEQQRAREERKREQRQLQAEREQRDRRAKRKRAQQERELRMQREREQKAQANQRSSQEDSDGSSTSRVERNASARRHISSRQPPPIEKDPLKEDKACFKQCIQNADAIGLNGASQAQSSSFRIRLQMADTFFVYCGDVDSSRGKLNDIMTLMAKLHDSGQGTNLGVYKKIEEALRILDRVANPS